MASSVRVAVNPDVLEWARSEAGYSLEELAKSIAVKPARLDAWERGADKPTVNQVSNVARVLRRTPAFFLRSEVPTSDVPHPPDFRSAENADYQSVALRAELRAVSERRLLYLRVLEEAPEPFALDIDTSDVAEAARQARELLGIAMQDQRKAKDYYQALALWTEALEAHGILVFQASSFPVAEARGASIFHRTLPIIVLNAKDAVAARTFTLLHELFHLCLGTGSVCDVEPSKARGVERRCNQFAAAALMPEEDIRAQMAAPKWTDPVGGLARRYRASELAVAIRLRDLDLVPQSVVNKVRAETAARLEQEEEDDRPIVVPYFRRKLRDLGRNYVGAVLSAYYADRLTMTDVSQYLGVKVVHVRSMEGVLQKSAGKPT